jgi:imidazolonepropionase-like amidohydrolase
MSKQSTPSSTTMESSLMSSSMNSAKLKLFRNVYVFDGLALKSEPQDVLIEGNMIKAVGKNLSMPPSSVDAAVITCSSNQLLMPGLIDCHSHLAIQEGIYEGRDSFDQMAMGAMTAHDLTDYLQQGFTTCRDAGGNVLSIAKAVNENRIPGPRIYACGAFLSQTGGHGDTGCCFDSLGKTTTLHEAGFSHIVDGRDEMLKAARNNLRNGATQLKIMAGGGVASELDPLHMTQLNLDEMKTAVEVANDYGTYVMAHAYHDNSINRCIDAGVKCIEHGFLMSDETMKRMKLENVAICIQAEMSIMAFAEPDKITFFTPDQKKKAKEVNSGAMNMMRLVRKYEPIAISGGDMFGKAYQHRQADNLVAMVEKGGFSTSFTLRTATSYAAQVLSWSKLNPYKEGQLGVIAPGAYADLILIDGNPLKNIGDLKRDKVKVVLKDGMCYKYDLPVTALQVVKSTGGIPVPAEGRVKHAVASYTEAHPTRAHIKRIPFTTAAYKSED